MEECWDNNGINLIIDKFLIKKTLTYNGKKSGRRYIHIDDACEACLKP